MSGRTRWRCGAAALMAALLGCGDGGGATAPDPDTVVPLEWEAGRTVAAGLVREQAEEPDTLADDVCALRLQLGRAASAGALPELDREGPCVVTPEGVDVDLADAPGFAPVAGGTVELFGRTYTLGEGALPDAMDVDCAELADPIVLRSFGGEVAEDALGEAEVVLPRGRVLDLQAPAPAGDGMALWPSGPLLVGWGGSGGASVEIVLRARDGGGPAVRCFVEDAGRFELPERLVAPYRDRIAVLEVARVTQAVVDVEGTELRLSDRRSDAVWLSP